MLSIEQQDKDTPEMIGAAYLTQHQLSASVKTTQLMYTFISLALKWLLERIYAY